jgi:hypothetical protein
VKESAHERNTYDAGSPGNGLTWIATDGGKFYAATTGRRRYYLAARPSLPDFTGVQWCLYGDNGHRSWVGEPVGADIEEAVERATRAVLHTHGDPATAMTVDELRELLADMSGDRRVVLGNDAELNRISPPLGYDIGWYTPGGDGQWQHETTHKPSARALAALLLFPH